MTELQHISLIKRQSCFHIETSHQLICPANDLIFIAVLYSECSTQSLLSYALIYIVFLSIFSFVLIIRSNRLETVLPCRKYMTSHFTFLHCMAT